jgi:hypothetical protein
MTMASQAAASSAGEPKARAPVSAASVSALPLLRFQAPASRPAPARLRAMGRPMAPSPMNPAFMPPDGTR